MIDRILEVLDGRRLSVLTGAGISTDSGIPDYRGPDSPPRSPMTYQQFVGDAAFRRHYWARNHLGWRYIDAARPNPGHRALTGLERTGVVHGVITQNVDLLHTKAGSRHVIDLHGTYAQVRCLACEHRISRMTLAERLDAANPGLAESMAVTTGVEIAPDADAIVERTNDFRTVDCDRCGGILKPDIVYFGESVPKSRVEAGFQMLAETDALMVVGSSLAVTSGLRFVRRAARDGKPIVIVNRGATRGDKYATIKAELGSSEVLVELEAALPA
ncbi:Sir2 family NAD-dependent protein deacetylase [Rhodococcus spongiicola]|uniref:NAD-dependent protein deacetylase n=1 Tax=Rhodococcus spongiicola TaxID=2487352 RepID=A0A438B1P6_9NOCA|nr:Sir2 family NAD-dependent protein deacetylase [Rhodococcus spongiicola]RVW04826.1 NAD-dependent deacetylase [Rhodococcus spongiicola]